MSVYELVCSRCRRPAPDGFVFDYALYDRSNFSEGLPEGWRETVQVPDARATAPTCPNCLTDEDEYVYEDEYGYLVMGNPELSA